MYSNRSLAYSKAQQHVKALHDAQKTIELAPGWAKGYWRMGVAFLGLKQTLNAIDAFAKCWHLDHGRDSTELHNMPSAQPVALLYVFFCAALNLHAIMHVWFHVRGHLHSHQAFVLSILCCIEHAQTW